MKPLLSFLSFGGALGLVMQTNGHSLGYPEFCAIFFSAGLAGWVIEIYSRKSLVIKHSQPVNLPSFGVVPKRALRIRYRKAA